MASINFPTPEDFLPPEGIKREYAKQNEKLALLAAEDQIQNDEKAVAAQKSLIKTLETSIQNAKDAFPRHKQRLSRLKLDYGPQETNLRNRENFLQCLKTEAEKSQLRSDEVEFRKMEIECSKRKSELLEQSLEVFELDWAVRGHDVKVESETLKLQKARKMLEDEEEALTEYKQHHQAAQHDWVRKWGAQSEMPEEAVILRATLEAANSTRHRQAEEIVTLTEEEIVLKATIEAANTTIQRQAEEIETLKNADKLHLSRTSSPSDLQDNGHSTDSGSVSDKTAVSVTNAELQESLAVSMKKIERHKDELAAIMPLYWIGFYTRSRKLEFYSHDNLGEDIDWEIINQGNMAAHNGAALADATMYMSFCPGPKKRASRTEYSKMYGIEPKTVWQIRKDSVFLEILDWKQDMENSADDYSRKKFQENFPKLFDQLRGSLPEKLDVLAKPDLKIIYDILRSERDAAVEASKAGRKSRRS